MGHDGLTSEMGDDFEHPEIYRLLIHHPKDDLLFFRNFF
jgi:hypothetical protein